ncbi:MAG: acetylxylan esterase [Candidatus Omnitrophica bacterium]|nr:acetylxylan esterase [Candidatus Omnitrophota bacterium]
MRANLSKTIPPIFLSAFFLAGLALGPSQAANPPGVIDLPGVDQLPEIVELPDPLISDGEKIATPEAWAKRREKIKRMILYYEYGHMPPAPGNVRVKSATEAPLYSGAATERRLVLSMGPQDRIEMHARLVVPTASKGPYPVLLQNTNALGNIPIEEEIIRRGYLIAEYLRTDLDPDVNGIVGPAQAAYPEYDWATLAVWAWGGLRMVDYLETLDIVDKGKIAITGHSRGGKTALLAGALDERIALVNPNGSGCGGAGCYRIQGPKSESLAAITDPKRFSYWFHPRFRDFADKETKLPFDQHFLKALVAPRALLSTEALEDYWANLKGTVATYRAAQPVFDFLGASDRNGIHFRPGKHNHSAEDWRALVDFADKHFHGKAVATRFDLVPSEDQLIPK